MLPRRGGGDHLGCVTNPVVFFWILIDIDYVYIYIYRYLIFCSIYIFVYLHTQVDIYIYQCIKYVCILIYSRSHHQNNSRCLQGDYYSKCRKEEPQGFCYFIVVNIYFLVLNFVSTKCHHVVFFNFGSDGSGFLCNSFV